MNHTLNKIRILKKWLVLVVVSNTKTIRNELQCNCDRTHMAYNEEFILVTNCLHCHIISILCMENSHIEKKTISSGTLIILGDS